MKKHSNRAIMLAMLLISAFAMCSCKKEIPATKETTIKTEVQEIAKPVDQVMEEVKNTKPVENKLSTDELITSTLIEHYQKQFPQDNPINSVGYKMYLIEDGNPGEKKAYGYASYFEYKIDGDKVTLDCGSGATPVAITFSLDGKVKRVDYEVLTDGDLKSPEFKAAFPESVQAKLLKRDPADMEEVNKKQKEMVKKQYKEITGKDLTTPIP